MSRSLIALCAVIAAAAVPLASARSLSVPSDMTVEATGPTGAVVTFDAGGLTCIPSSGSTFPLGDTTVNCVDASSAQAGSFIVHVVDTTPPALSLPAPISADATSASGAVVNYTVTATDVVDPSPVVSCSPVSGSTFPLGTTTVNCTAKDTTGNTSSGPFNVTVGDHVVPTLGAMPSVAPVSTENPSGTAVTYTTPAATDNIDPSPTVSCLPASGSTFPIGTTTVTCTARDASGNESHPGTFVVTVNLVDRTPPVLTVPASFSVDTENPGGTAVTYTASATDNIDPSPSVTCNPASGSTFPIGSTTVNCSAHDASGNHSEGPPFTVTVHLVDHTPPVITGVADRTVEANGPGGSVVNFPKPTATDALDGPIAAVSCVPASGTTFSLGTTTVTCSATDAHGNTGTASFHVKVQDTTPPTLIVPVATSVYATTPTGIPDTVSGVVSFLSAASATDIVDPSPVVTNNAPHFLPVGTLMIDFLARDASGNSTSKDVEFIVLPQPPAGTPPLPTPAAPKPPPDVQKLTGKPLDGAAKITWKRPPGTKEAIVTRFTGGTRVTSGANDGLIVYRGPGSRYVDRGLQNGVEYRYVVVTVDAAGNQSAGIAVVVFPRRDLLRSPKDGARLRKAPLLLWTHDSKASYYNIQLLLNGAKILSAWPTSPTFALRKSWTYDGQKYTLKPGSYQWYVWPGYGARSDVNYGELLGSRSFQIVR